MLLHGGVQPTVRSRRSRRSTAWRRLRRDHPIVGWKVYTHAPGDGWWLDDHDAAAPQVGEAFLARVEEVGPRIVCVHKGFSGGSEYASPVDIGPAATAHPDLRFVVYHSGFEAGVDEGPYVERRSRRRPAGAEPARRRRRARRQRLRRARLHLVEPDARPDAGRARARQAARGGRRPTTCCGVPTRSGTAHRRTRSRRSAPSRSRPSSRSATATRADAGR